MKGLHGWMRLLESNETAVLSTLLNEIDHVTRSDNSSGDQLAEIILKDAFLTAKIIRVANSVIFNPNELPITTVSRAVINIGFKNIRSICLSIKVLESILNDRSSPLLMASLAKSLHAANQAKFLCQKLSEMQQEEVFVATLFLHLAELLVLGHREEEVKAYVDQLTSFSTDQEKERAAEKYLGVSISRLSKTLVKQWKMQGLIQEVVNSSEVDTDSRIIQAIRIANEISRASLLGWQSNEFKEVSEKAAEYLDVSPNLIAKSLIKIADDTAETIASFGKKNLIDYLPTSKRPAKQLLSEGSNQVSPLGDEAYQRQVLSELNAMLRSDFNLNHVINLVLSGLHKGVGLERLSLAIFDRLHSKFVAKSVMGQDTEHWQEKFVLCFERNPHSFLFQLFQYEQSVWVGAEQFKEICKNLHGEFIALTSQPLFFIAPLKINKKMIGFIYADNGASSKELTLKAFESFNEFMLKANAALNLMAKRT